MTQAGQDTKELRSRLYAELPPGVPRLRVVVLVDEVVAPAWIGETLTAIAECDASELVAIVAVAAPLRARYSWLFELYLRMDGWLGGNAAIATAKCSLAAQVPLVRLLSSELEETRDGRLELTAADRQSIAALQPHLLVAFGLPPIGAKLAATAVHGGWSFERYATDFLCTGLRFLGPIMDGSAVTLGGVAVHVSSTDRWTLLQPSWCATSQLSFARNRAHQLLRIPAEIARALRELAIGQTLNSLPLENFEPPGLPELAYFGVRLVIRAVRRQLPRWGRVESWLLAVRRDAPAMDPQQPEARGMRILKAPSGSYWADPCPVREGGRDYVFVEQYDETVRRGHIAVLELDEDLAVRSVRSVLDVPWHLSYPFVFTWQEQRWMIVESAEARQLTLYHCTRFPDEWKEAGDLLYGWSVVDGTVHFDGRRWYLFANITESPFGYDQRVWDDLFVFYADSPAGPWHPHAANPVVSDVRSARPAGRLFMHEGRLIRPSQDCSVDYGYAIVFNEVLVLDEHHYQERSIGRLEPDWCPGLRGCHTYSSDAGLELLDGKFLIPRPPPE